MKKILISLVFIILFFIPLTLAIEGESVKTISVSPMSDNAKCKLMVIEIMSGQKPIIICYNTTS